MKNFLCRYEKLGNKKVGISNDTFVSSEDSFINEIISDIKGTGKINKINFESEIPDSVIQIINGEFGNVYRENKEGYVIIIENEITIYSESVNGFIYAAAMLKRKCTTHLGKGIIYNYPRCEFRGVKLFIPARNQIDFFKEYIKFCAYYTVNSVMLEVGGAMEYKRHPEINEGWCELCKDLSEYPGKGFKIMTSKEYYKNVFHPENGGFSFLSQDEVKDIILYMKNLGISVIPEVPSLSHSDYLLFNHRELAERKDDLYPDTYCPSDERSYKLLFDVIDEVIDVFKPSVINIGHDEWMSGGICEKCKGKNLSELYASDIIKIYNYLKKNGIGTMLWGDKLLNAITKNGECEGGAIRIMKNYVTGKWHGCIMQPTYESLDLIPKDIKISHWYWIVEKNLEKEFINRNFYTIYGNFYGSQMFEWNERVSRGIKGVCTSNWGTVDKVHMQRNGMFYYIAFNAALMWENDTDTDNFFKENSLRAIKDINDYRNQNLKNYIEVIHSLDARIPHDGFNDGNWMDYDKDYVGKYIITYENGEKQEEPIYYGLNIGYMRLNWDRKMSRRYDVLDTAGHLFEPTYTCDYVMDNKNFFFKYRIPLNSDKKVSEVSFKARKEYKDKFYLKSVKFS